MIVKNVEKQEKSTTAFDVVCSAAEFEKAINTVYQKNKSQIYIQGFRKGKAPRMVIEGMYGKDVFYEDATDELAPEAFRFAVEELGLRAVGRPAVKNVDVSEEKELTLSFVTAVWPEVTLGQYRGVEAPKPSAEVSEEKVAAELAKVQKRNARIVTVERPAQKGDTVVIDYLGTVDGVAFDGGAAEGHNLELGSNSFIPGFEDGVVGMSAGEERDIDVTFPEEYHAEELAGKPAVFHVKCQEVKEEQLPELDDELAKDVSEFDTMEEYKASVRTRLEESAAAAAEEEFHNELIIRAGDAIQADIPDAMVEEQIDNMINEYDQNLQMNGLNLQLYLQYLGQSVADFREQCRPTAERRVKTELLLDAVATAEGIEVTQEDIDAEYEKVADQYQTSLETVKGAVPVDAITSDIRTRRAAEIIFSTGVPTEPVAEEEAEEAPAEEAAPSEDAAPAAEAEAAPTAE